MSFKVSILKELTSASILLALITALLYFSGATYIGSYLAEWGVEPNLISSSNQEIFIYGALVWFVGGIKLSIYAAVIGIMVFLPIYMIVDVSKIPQVRGLSLKIYQLFKPKNNNSIDPPRVLQVIVTWSIQAFKLVALIILSLYFLFELLEFSSAQATKKAREEYVQFSTDEITDKKLFNKRKKVVVGNQVIDGYLLMNSEKFAVFYLPEQSGEEESIKVIKLDAIESLTAVKYQHNKALNN